MIIRNDLSLLILVDMNPKYLSALIIFFIVGFASLNACAKSEVYIPPFLKLTIEKEDWYVSNIKHVMDYFTYSEGKESRIVHNDSRMEVKFSYFLIADASSVEARLREEKLIPLQKYQPLKAKGIRGVLFSDYKHEYNEQFNVRFIGDLGNGIVLCITVSMKAYTANPVLFQYLLDNIVVVTPAKMDALVGNKKTKNGQPPSFPGFSFEYYVKVRRDYWNNRLDNDAKSAFAFGIQKGLDYMKYIDQTELEAPTEGSKRLWRKEYLKENTDLAKFGFTTIRFIRSDENGMWWLLHNQHLSDICYFSYDNGKLNHIDHFVNSEMILYTGPSEMIRFSRDYEYAEISDCTSPDSSLLWLSFNVPDNEMACDHSMGFTTYLIDLNRPADSVYIMQPYYADVKCDIVYNMSDYTPKSSLNRKKLLFRSLFIRHPVTNCLENSGSPDGERFKSTYPELYWQAKKAAQENIITFSGVMLVEYGGHPLIVRMVIHLGEIVHLDVAEQTANGLKSYDPDQTFLPFLDSLDQVKSLKSVSMAPWLETMNLEDNIPERALVRNEIIQNSKPVADILLTSSLQSSPIELTSAELERMLTLFNTSSVLKKIEAPASITFKLSTERTREDDGKLPKGQYALKIIGTQVESGNVPAAVISELSKLLKQTGRFVYERKKNFREMKSSYESDIDIKPKSSNTFYLTLILMP
jgi:hypothetical protein